MTRSEFLSPDELAERYGIPVASVYRWLSTGTGPPSLKIGKHRRYRFSDVLRWEDERTDRRAEVAAL
jgi:excisionase family DNA binding protein